LGAVKRHTLLDLRGSIPIFIHVSDGKLHGTRRARSSSHEPEEVPAPSAPHALQAPGHRAHARLPDQPVRPDAEDHLRTVQGPLAGGAVLQVDLRIKNFCGTSESAVKSQIWVAVVLVAIIRKRRDRDAALCTSLQILSVTSVENKAARSTPFQIRPHFRQEHHP